MKTKPKQPRIKNCPFCGWKGMVVSYYKKQLWSVKCFYCGSGTSDDYFKELTAVKAWNRRAKPPTKRSK